MRSDNVGTDQENSALQSNNAIRQTSDPDGPLQVDAILFRPDMYKEFGMPDYKTVGSAGIDLRACIDEPITLAPNQVVMIPSGLKVHVGNPDYAAILLPRSGLGAKHGIVLGNLVGLIDSDYQGEMGMSIWNRSNESYTIHPGDRVAQMVVIKVEQIRFNWVESFEDTERGEGGFGSTGVSDSIKTASGVGST